MGMMHHGDVVGCELGLIINRKQGVNSIYLNPSFFPLTEFSTGNIICMHTALILLISYLQNRMQATVVV